MTKGEQARLMAWRLRVLQHAAHEQNVARICRRFGISRKSFYKWKQRHAQCGDAGLVDPHPSGWPATDQLNRTGNVGEPLV
jgi:transposase-like protein